MNSVSVLHLADVHIGMENYGRLDPATGLNGRVMDFLRRLAGVVDYALENEVDLVLFAGDAYKSRDPNSTYRREFARRIKRLADAGIPVVLLVGNHDLPAVKRRASSIEIFRTLEVPNVLVAGRESLHTLEQYGLVTGVDKQGFVVREFGRQELIDAYRVREVLEGLAARLCCRKASRDDVEWLRNTARQIHAQSGTGSRDDRSGLEYQFHQRFLLISSNEMLQRVSIGYRFVGNLVVTNRQPDQLLEEHLAVVEAVADNRPDDAERLARQHVTKSADSIIRHQA